MYDAWLTNSTLVLDHFDSVAEKIYFNFNINKITRGTVVIDEEGAPVFTKA